MQNRSFDLKQDIIDIETKIHPLNSDWAKNG